MTAINETLRARQQTHGSFELNAEISQRMKQYWKTCPGYGAMTAVQAEALDMIALKISRILSGQSHHDDHWRDISGYATLAVMEIEGAAIHVQPDTTESA